MVRAHGHAVLSCRIRMRAKRRRVTYSFLFMRASGAQLRELTMLIDAGHLRPVVDRVFPFDATPRRWRTSTTGAPRARSLSRSTSETPDRSRRDAAQR